MAEEENIDKIRRLKPEDRIDRLRKLEEKKRKEIREAERAIEESLAEIRRDTVIREVATPGLEAPDITRRFKPEEESLEAIAADAPKQEETEQILQQYQTRLQGLKETSYESPNPEERDRLREEADRIYQNLRDIRDHYRLSERATEMLATSRAIAYNIRKYNE